MSTSFVQLRCFLKILMPSINATNNSPNTIHSRFTNLVSDITPSHAHSSVSLLRDRHTHCFQFRSSPCYPNLGCIPPVKVLLSATQHSLLHPDPPARSQRTPQHPYLHISFHRPISPVQHRALYKKIIMLLCTTCSWRAYTHLSS